MSLECDVGSVGSSDGLKRCPHADSILDCVRDRKIDVVDRVADGVVHWELPLSWVLVLSLTLLNYLSISSFLSILLLPSLVCLSLR